MQPLSRKTIRPPAVAGLFYPGDAVELRESVSEYLRDASEVDLPAPPKALIVPHAGYIYSGGIAAAGYALIAARQHAIHRIVLVGPSHRVYFRGVAIPQAELFRTPLGDVVVDPRLSQLTDKSVVVSDQPHAMEHSLEVQLPFLQVLFAEFELVPLVTGDVPAATVASVLDAVWGDEQTLVIASSDLSHYHDYATAQRLDAQTSASILRYDVDLSGDQACGATPINGLLYAARERKLAIREIARCNSGDTAGDRSRVVGYGCYALFAASN